VAQGFLISHDNIALKFSKMCTRKDSWVACTDFTLFRRV